MEWISQAIEWFLHLDRHLEQLLRNYGNWTYAVLFVIVFCETGLVITPFLPGDSLLFAAGALCHFSDGGLNPLYVGVTLWIAAVIGDAVNYHIGKYVGPAIFKERKGLLGRLLKKEHLDRTHAFYEKYGAKTIVLARFVPIIRTFAPFIAGVGRMSYWKFGLYNIAGGAIWVWSLVLAGWWFGNVPVIKNNFSLVVVAIIAISLLPMVYEYWMIRRAAKESAAKPE